MITMGEYEPGEPAASAAAAFFQIVASLRPSASLHAARRVLVADLLTRDARAEDRSAALMACLLADVGRVILRLPTSEAAERGADLVRTIPGLQTTADAIHHRYERINGTGVPSGLSGNDIPFASRVVALTDLLVAQRRGLTPDWDRRIEIVKDHAGTSLDTELAAGAYDLMHTPGVRSVIDNATAGTALAIIEGAASRSPDPLGGLGSLIETIGEPSDAAQILAEMTWARSSFRAVGVHRAHGTMLTPLAVAGDRAERWSPLALTEAMAELTEPMIAGAGDDIVRIVPIRIRSLWGLAWGTTDNDDHDADPITELARAIAATVGRDAEHRRLEQLAHHDELTGLGNRRRLEAELDALFAADTHERADAALIMCDVDGLKRVNDTRGHAAGDDVLRAVAVALADVTGGSDALVARLGGDEFCVLLRRGGILRAQSVARTAADQVKSSAPAGVGLSCGVAYAAHADTASELLRRADEAQYLAKRHRSPRSDDRLSRDRRRRSHR
jgi:diguanylate cyclase (GGDEF)-like protein